MFPSTSDHNQARYFTTEVLDAPATTMDKFFPLVKMSTSEQLLSAKVLSNYLLKSTRISACTCTHYQSMCILGYTTLHFLGVFLHKSRRHKNLECNIRRNVSNNIVSRLQKSLSNDNFIFLDINQKTSTTTQHPSCSAKHLMLKLFER